MKFAIFGLSASVDNRPPPGAWVAELQGVGLGVHDHKIIKFPLRVYIGNYSGTSKVFPVKTHNKECVLLLRERQVFVHGEGSGQIVRTLIPPLVLMFIRLLYFN